MSARALLAQTFVARAESLRVMRDAISQALTRARIDASVRERLILAVDEAAANIIRHAYGGNCDCRIVLVVARTRGRLRIRLRDDAAPVQVSCIKPRDLNECRPGGLGINFIAETMDRWQLRALKSHRGNVLVMEKKSRPVKVRHWCAVIERG